LTTRSTSWADYEEVFVQALEELRIGGVQAGVFGDIDVDDHRRWEEKVCAAAGIEPHLPLWAAARGAPLDELVDLGFRAIVVAVCDEKLDRRYLGRTIDRCLVDDFEREGIDLAGESGEYHTVVVDGPLFASPLRLEIAGASEHSGYWFLDISTGGSEEPEESDDDAAQCD
jgi:uncharacterized protein (TIGR00290 family)